MEAAFDSAGTGASNAGIAGAGGICRRGLGEAATDLAYERAYPMRGISIGKEDNYV